MAASSADKFTETKGSAGNPSVTTASAPRTVGGTSLTATALTNWPTGTQVHFITYSKNADGTKDNTSQQDWKGTVSSSTSLTSMALTNGTDAGNAIGDYIEMGPTASWAEDLYDGLTQTLNTDGTLQSSIVTTAKINDGAVTTAKLASGAVTSSTLAESAVTYAKLLSTIFSGQVQSYTNTASCGGTFYYVNLGGIKLVFGTTNSISTAAGGATSFSINMPSSFLTTVQARFSNVSSLTVQPSQYVNTSCTTTSADGFVVSVAASGATAKVDLLVIGT